MASVRKRKNGTCEIRFIDHENNRRSLYVGKIAKRDAEAIAAKVEHIVSRKVQGSEPDPNVGQWVAKLPDRLHEKLARLGLAAARKPSQSGTSVEIDSAPTIRQWTGRYLRRHNVQQATIDQLEITARSLCRFFGDDRRINSLTPGDAEDFRKWLETKGNERKGYKAGLAKNTVRRRIGRCKQFFRYAMQHKIIDSNPFASEVSMVTGNDSRMVMVPHAWIESCIRVSPSEDWRIILALARYAGMRKHETLIQRWDDIDLANGRMLVRSHKTPAERICPIFSELRPHLLRARAMAPKRAKFIQTSYRPDHNLVPAFHKIIAKAGLVPWGKPLQNLRASRETELFAKYPEKDVTSWLGNSPRTANRHYAMVMQESFDRAIHEARWSNRWSKKYPRLCRTRGVRGRQEKQPIQKLP